jgi:hypothetical protein
VGPNFSSNDSVSFSFRFRFERHNRGPFALVKAFFSSLLVMTNRLKALRRRSALGPGVD